MDRRTAFNLLAALLLTGALLGSLPVAGQVNASHLAAVKNEPGQDPNAPFGTWTNVVEPITFHPHEAGDGNTERYLDYAGPSNITAPDSPLPFGDPTADQSATFTLPVKLQPTEDVRIYAFSASIAATCIAIDPLDLEDIKVRVTVNQLSKSGDAWSVSDSRNFVLEQSQPTFNFDDGTVGVYRFSGESVFGTVGTNTGLRLAAPAGSSAGHRLQVTIEPFVGQVDDPTGEIGLPVPLLAVSCAFGNPTSFVVKADSGRINTWVENKEGNLVSGLPTPSRTQASERRFLTQVVHVSAWPMLDAYRPGSTGTTVNYQEALWNSALSLRMRDLTTGSTSLIGSGVDNVQRLSRVANDLGDSVNRIEYLFTYPANLPERSYRMEVASTGGGIAASPDFKMGLRGLTVESLDNPNHTVNALEPTDFRFRITNIGAEDDTASVAVTPPGESWQAEIQGGSLQFLKANGAAAEVVVRVTPPATALAGNTKQISIVTSSVIFPVDVTPITRTVNVTVTNAVNRSVDVTTSQTLVLLQPGVETLISGVRVTNTGTASDVFGLTTVLPNGITGWTTQVTPLSREIAAQSSDTFTVKVRAPVDAPAGQTFALGLVASRLGDAAVTDRADITVSLQVTHGLEVSVLDSTLSTRSVRCSPNNAGVCQRTETDADRSIVFHLRVTNTGPLQDTLTVSGDWDMGAAGTTDIGGTSPCDSTGHPDHWRNEYGDASVTNAEPAQTGGVSTTLTIPGKGSVDRYLVLGYSPDFCGTPDGSIDASLTGAFDLTFRSNNDRSKERSLSLVATRTAEGVSVRGPVIATDLSDVDGIASTQPGTSVTHTFRVLNQANEKDLVLVTVPASSDGWTRRLEVVPSGTTGVQDNVPRSLACENLAGTTANRFRCPMGVYDEAAFRLIVSAAANKALGSSDRAVVTVTSVEDATKSDQLEFLTTAVGQFQFVAQELALVHEGVRGQSMAVPFVLRNLGTQADTLNLTLLAGDASWTPRLGIPSAVFVPAGRDLAGFLSVVVPTAATSDAVFRIQVSSQGNGAIDTLDFTVRPIAASALRLSGLPSNLTTLPSTEQAYTLTVQVTESGGTAGRSVTVTPNVNALPAGWTVTPSSRQVTLAAGSGATTAQTTFQVTAPANTLATSRVPILMRANSTSPTTLSTATDLIVQLADVYGVGLAADGPENQTVVPGGEVIYRLQVSNLGNSADTVRITTSSAPAGWLIQTDPAELLLGPLENRTVNVIVGAPVDAAPRAQALTTLQATSLGGGAATQRVISTIVGFYEVRAAMNLTNATAVPKVAPNEVGSYVVSVLNNGTLPDEVRVNVTALNAAHAGVLTFTAEPALVQLDPGQAKDVRIDVKAGATAPSQSTLPFRMTLSSVLDPVVPGTVATLNGSLEVLRYVALDADRDLVNEYAVDRDGDTANGFESFADSNLGGKDSRVADLRAYLSDAAEQSYLRNVVVGNNTTQQFVFQLDGDGDGRTDFFLDSSGDGLPDAYWDPDRNASHQLTVFKDINADASPDYFVDTTGEGDFDAVYDLRTGKFVPLLVLDVDGDGENDYGVDADGDGLLDANETVLYTRDGLLITVSKVDVDDDGELDSVFDIDGDGQPDYFIPNGEESPVEIVLQDANKDGTADWTFDSNDDGRVDSYYDPLTGEVGRIDTTGDFVDALRDHWYIGALFVLVVVLFVALVAVTRR